MPIIEYSRKRVRAFLQEVERIRAVDFPYDHSRTALDRIKVEMEKQLAALDATTPKNTHSIVINNCATSLGLLCTYLRLLGFILRSTDVRNSFEVYGPLLRIAKQLLGPDVVLVLSSEWEYSPHIYKTAPGLSGLVMIGLPACEADNPLLVPLAGHELGHAVWAKQQLATPIAQVLEAAVLQEVKANWGPFQALTNLVPGTDLKAKKHLGTWIQASLWATGQAEESFCDFLGLRIFGESFAHATAYLLSPRTEPGYRHCSYPTLLKRALNLKAAAAKYGITIPTNYEAFFENKLLPSLSPMNDYWLGLADKALDTVIPTLIDLADQEVSKAKVNLGTNDARSGASASIKMGVPASGAQALANIINAGWDVWSDPQALAQLGNRREDALKEIVLKSIEVFEIEERVKP